jgi:hypothetical protein
VHILFRRLLLSFLPTTTVKQPPQKLHCIVMCEFCVIFLLPTNNKWWNNKHNKNCTALLCENWSTSGACMLHLFLPTKQHETTETRTNCATRGIHNCLVNHWCILSLRHDVYAAFIYSCQPTNLKQQQQQQQQELHCTALWEFVVQFL